MRRAEIVRRWAVASLLAAIMVAALPALAAQHARRSHSPAPAAETARIPDTLLPRVNASFAADDPAYAVAALPDDLATLRAINPAQRLTTTFAPDGVTIAGQGDARWTLHLAAVGTRDTTPIVVPIVAGGRVEYHRGDLTEWYMNGPLGVEQGFTLTAPPTAGDALTLTLAVSGDATPRLDGDAVTLVMPDRSALTYGHLLVTDAAGRHLPARLSVDGGSIAITADLTVAVYPVTVDPLVETKKLIASDGATSDFFGADVAMSGDGSRVIVGASGTKVGTNAYQGAAYIYSGPNYATEQKLIASDGAANDYFGTAVAISSDGTRVVVGANNRTVGANKGQGAAYVYSGGNNATEKRLTANDGATGDSFGGAVAISDDGTRVIVGAFGKKIGLNGGQGEVYVFGASNGPPSPVPPSKPPGAPSGSPGPAPAPKPGGGGGGSPNPIPPPRP